ncbi:MAG: hypothetical protein K6F27_13530 [Ruminococcus sp.]|nr:hypothetical protein [Ruminococcus sp.]
MKDNDCTAHCPFCGQALEWTKDCENKRADNFPDDYILELRGRTLQEWVKKIERGEVKEVKHARWIKGKDWDDWFCSGCSNKAALDWRENPILSSFCPQCGAEMDFCGAEMDFCGAKKEENDRLEESFQKATVSREQFNRAANEIGDSIEDGNDKMAIAVFVNELEEKLFGGK